MSPKGRGASKGFGRQIEDLVRRNEEEHSKDPLALLDSIGDIDLDGLLESDDDMVIDGVPNTNVDEDETQPPSQHDVGTGI